MRGFAEFRGSYRSAVNFLGIGFWATVTDASRSSDFVICGAASRADQVVTDRARDSSIRSATALASASAARTSKLHVCVQRATGWMNRKTWFQTATHYHHHNNRLCADSPLRLLGQRPSILSSWRRSCILYKTSGIEPVYLFQLLLLEVSTFFLRSLQLSRYSPFSWIFMMTLDLFFEYPVTVCIDIESRICQRL